MIDLILAAGFVLLLILFSELRKTTNDLRARVAELETQVAVLSPSKPVDVLAPLVAPKPKQMAIEPKIAERAAKTIVAAERITQTIKASPPIEEESPEPPASLAKRFEELIGGKLPIWIGGIALIFAGFFLVRFSIEAGLFGPTTRCITAVLFGLLLIGLSEFGNKIPKFGSVFTDDLRIGHSIAGAGIAVLYATLYMASELYGLLGLTSALIGVVAVTILAFYLSQKHGPPTAIMGLLGGFSAPYVAGLGPESVAPLLVYLGVFTAGVFGLAIHRGWAWLALLATGGSALWTTALLFLDVSGDIPFVGAFITLLAIGGVLTLSRTGTSFGIPKAVMQAIPLSVGLLQLMTLAPLIEFSPISWLFFAVLAIFTIALAWRDQTMTPAVGGALALCLTMIAMAFSAAGPNPTELYPAVGLALLFGIAGHVFALREKDGWIWALVGLAAPTMTLGLIAVLADLDWSERIWGVAHFAVASTTAIMAWRTRTTMSGAILPLSSALTAIFLVFALWCWTATTYVPLVTAILALGLAYWTQITKRRAIAIETTVAVVLTGLLMLFPNAPIFEAMFMSLGGETDLYRYLPDVGEMIIKILLPTVTIIGLVYFFRTALGGWCSTIIAAVGMMAAGSFIYLLFKQPMAIGPAQGFIAYGFAERMVLTQMLALSGWLLLKRNWNGDLSKPLRWLGFILAGLALFRFTYFDLFLLSPINVAQSLGPAPVANLGTLHFTAMALWLWLYANSLGIADTWSKLMRPLKIASLLTAVAAVLITIRQAVHGSNITSTIVGFSEPPFNSEVPQIYTSTETYLYSAGLLLLAVAWLARGIQIQNAFLRIAGLLLLTAITFKVFLVDAAQLDGILRILSFLGLGIALIGIGWIYGKVMRSGETN